MGSCKNKANYAIKMERVGIKSVIYICSDCMKELYSVLGEHLTSNGVGEK